MTSSVYQTSSVTGGFGKMVTSSLLSLGGVSGPHEMFWSPQAAGPSPVAVAVVDLTFDPGLGPAGLLILRVEIDA